MNLNFKTLERHSFLPWCIYFLYCIFWSNDLKSQGCITPSDSKSIQLISNSPAEKNNVPFYLKIYIHVIRDNSGNGGVTHQQVLNSLAYLNRSFNPQYIYFVWDCEIDYIDDDVMFLNGPFVTNNLIFTYNPHEDGIDIYIFPDDLGPDNFGGRAFGIGEESAFWVGGTWPSGEVSSQSHIMSHEMGHVLNLHHTHRGCDELPNGSNCQSAGDGICDTPADPDILFQITSSCEWNGTPVCSSSDLPVPIGSYNPDPSLIMSNSDPRCLTCFTPHQVTGMRNAIVQLPHLIAAQTTDIQGDCSCGPALTVTGVIPTGTYENHSSIIAYGAIGASQSVTFEAGEFVLLEQPFLADASNASSLLAFTKECNPSIVYPVYGCNGIPAINDDPNNTPQSSRNDHSQVSSIRNYPNPFSKRSIIEFTLTTDEEITLFVSDLMGKKVNILLNNNKKTKGTHQVIFDGRDYPAGIYYYTIQLSKKSITQKMTIIK